MAVDRDDSRPIQSDYDVVAVRRLVREMAIAAGFGLVDQTKMITAASELARNTLEHGGGGALELAIVVDGGRRGLRLVFADAGPGIADPELALRDGYTTGGGLGLGLGGARRLVHDFEIHSKPGEGTRVTVTRWR